MGSDHYTALGVSPLASRAEVRAAYLRVMREAHPDRARGDPAAGARARRANAAWEVLGDARARADYDRARRRRLVAHSPAGHALATRLPNHPPAYSPDRAGYSRAFTRASVRVASGVLAVGLVLLLLTVG